MAVSGSLIPVILDGEFQSPADSLPIDPRPALPLGRR